MKLNNKIFNKQNLIPFAEVFSKIVSLINILLLMKVLLISEFADYSYIIAIVLWASVLMDGGINNLVFNKSLKNDLQDINALFSARFILSFLIITTIFLFFFITKPELKWSAFLYAIIIFLSSSSAFIKMLSRGKGYHQVDLTVILLEPLLRLFVFGIVYFAFDEKKWDLWILMIVYLVAGVFAFGVNYILLSKKHVLKVNISNINKLFTQLNTTFQASKYYLFYYFLYIGLIRIDMIFLEKYSTKSMLAWFSAAIMLYGVMQLFFLTIITSQFKRIYKYEKKAVFVLLVLLVFVVLATNTLSSFVYDWFFSDEYKGGNEVLNLIIWAIIPSVLTYYITAKLNYEHKTYVNAYIMLFPLIFKWSIYSFLQAKDILTYQKYYVLTEYILLICFVLYLLLRKKQINEEL